MEDGLWELLVAFEEGAMGSKKRSSWSKQKAELDAGLDDFSGMDDIFAREEAHRERAGADHEAARRRKACESKNRYASRAEAEENLAWCEHNGKRGLSVYRCPYCDGWHLTSHPWDE